MGRSPIWLTSDYFYEGLEHYADVVNERRPGFVYGRYGNPTHVALHRVLASLEGAEAAWSFASGMAALHAAITSLVKTAGHVVAQRTVYGGTLSLLKEVLPSGQDGAEEVVPSKLVTNLHAGDRVVFETAGGGGYGDPAQRTGEQLRADVADGKVSREAAASYGVTHSPDTT